MWDSRSYCLLILAMVAVFVSGVLLARYILNPAFRAPIRFRVRDASGAERIVTPHRSSVYLCYPGDVLLSIIMNAVPVPFWMSEKYDHAPILIRNISATREGAEVYLAENLRAPSPGYEILVYSEYGEAAITVAWIDDC